MMKNTANVVAQTYMAEGLLTKLITKTKKTTTVMCDESAADVFSIIASKMGKSLKKSYMLGTI